MRATQRSRSRASSVVRGSVALLGRQLVTLLVTFGGGIFLSRLLSPAEYGAYALIITVAAVTKLLVDGGLAASLIQQTSEPTKDERSVIFTFQLGAAAVFAVAVIVLAPYLSRWMGAPDGTTASLYFVAIAIFAAPFTSISFVMIERRLQFGLLGLLLTIQPVFFNVIAVVLALFHLGVLALGIAFAASNILVVPAAIWAVKGIPTLLVSRGALVGRFRFALPFVGTTVVSTVKDAVNPLFVGVVVGASAAGYLNWAQQIAVIGTFTLGILTRLLFPVFARVKDDPRALETAVPTILFWANMTVAPVTLFIGVFARELTSNIYGPQWAPAIPLFYLLLLANVISPTSSVLIALMNAIGKPMVSFGFALAWFAATWILVPIFVTLAKGFIGYGYANAIIQIISLGLIFAAKRYVDFKWLSALTLPWLYSGAAFALVVIPVRLMEKSPSLLEVMIAGFVAMALLSVIVCVFSKQRAQYLWRTAFQR